MSLQCPLDKLTLHDAALLPQITVTAAHHEHDARGSETQDIGAGQILMVGYLER
jgi:hypothetical protein